MTKETCNVIAILAMLLGPPLLLCTPPIWFWWPSNWKRYHVTSTKMDGIYGYRITFLPATKGLRPFLPDQIQITKSWFSWNITVHGWRGDKLPYTHNRSPGEIWPHPLRIMRWLCEEVLKEQDAKWPAYCPLDYWERTIKSRLLVPYQTTQAMIEDYCPGYRHVGPTVYRYNDDY